MLLIVFMHPYLSLDPQIHHVFPPSSAFVSTAFSLTVCVSASRRLSPYKDEGPSSSRMTSAQPDCICRDPVSKGGHGHRFWVDMIVGRWCTTRDRAPTRTSVLVSLRVDV